MKKWKFGTGITSYEVNMGDVRNREDMERVRASWSTWNDDIKKYGGIFGAVSKRAYETSRSILAHEPYTEETPEHSPSDFAHVIVCSIDCAKIEIENKNADLAARHAFDAGVKWALAQVKFQWEDKALCGERQLKASERGRTIRSSGSFANRHGEKAQERANELFREKPSRTWTRIREMLAAEFKVSSETIKGSVRNPKKKG
ncbi:hypothetical protein [Rhodovulum sp. BSW8]|uniref:hypothetical protein n=1 Tax=Rhodovulum sp. BSW8 TaxID=2259645 RepID=UPI001058D9FE|nr:hypothetical protein [Rhodovulum sp. BSW8]